MNRTVDIKDRIDALPRAELRRMAAAGSQIRNCLRVLHKVKANIVGELLKNQGTFYEWNHYPKGDVIDWETHSQYYYHAHPKAERPGEHGHFHTFLRYEGMDRNATPAPLSYPQKPNKDRIGAHLIAISMNKKGMPLRIFTTNRWVTDETWYDAATVAGMIDRFVIDHTFPSWATNIWLTNMLALFKPQITDLLEQRDQRIHAAGERLLDADVFEDRRLEVISETDIDIEKQIELISAVLSHRAA